MSKKTKNQETMAQAEAVPQRPEYVIKYDTGLSLEEKMKKEVAARKEAILKEIHELELDNFQVPEGLPIPYRDALVVLPIQQNETKRASGIIIPAGHIGDPANSKKMGIVCRIGPDVTLPVTIGSKVYFDSSARYFNINGNDTNVYLLMYQHHIFAAVTPGSYPVPSYYTREQERMIERREGLARVAQDEANKIGEESDGKIIIK